MANRVKPSLVDSIPGLWRVAAMRSKSVDLLRVAKLKWPVYDVWRHFLNRESKTLFLSDSSAVRTSLVQKRIIDELKTRGISIVDVGELLPKENFLLNPPQLAGVDLLEPIRGLSHAVCVHHRPCCTSTYCQSGF
jgi:hypothetical protein